MSIIDNIVSLATHRLRHGPILNIEYFLMFSAGRCSEKNQKKYSKSDKSKFDDNFDIQRQLEHFVYEIIQALNKYLVTFIKAVFLLQVYKEGNKL